MEPDEDNASEEFRKQDRARSLVILWTFAGLILLDAAISLAVAITFGVIAGLALFLVAFAIVHFAMRKSLLSIWMLEGPWPR